MNCPVCSTQMQKGFFGSRYQPIQWIPEGGKLSSIKGEAAKNAVVFGGGDGFWGGYEAEAYYCPTCCMALLQGK